MIGYHLTSESAWASIQREGLRVYPHRLNRYGDMDDGNREWLGQGTYDVAFLYPPELDDDGFVGAFVRTLVFRASTAEPRVVVLRVHYEADDAWTPVEVGADEDGDISCSITCENISAPHIPLVLLKRPIPPERIEHVATLTIPPKPW